MKDTCYVKVVRFVTRWIGVVRHCQQRGGLGRYYQWQKTSNSIAGFTTSAAFDPWFSEQYLNHDWSPDCNGSDTSWLPDVLAEYLM